MPNTGYKQVVNWANEATYGTPVTVNQSLGIVQSVNPTEKNNLMKIRSMGSGSRDYSNIVAGKFEISGSMEYYLQGCAFLRQAMGEDTATTSTIDSGPKFHSGGATAGTSYLHIMGSAASPLVNSFPSFTLEFADSEDAGGSSTVNLKRIYNGCRVNSMTISGTVDEPVKAAVDWAALNVTISTAAATSVTQPTTDPFVFYQGAVYATSGAVTAYTVPAAVSEIAEVNSFDFGVNNNLETVWYIGGTTSVYQSLRGPRVLIPKGRDYTGSLNLHFKDKGMFNKFLGAAAGASVTGPQATLTGYTVVLDFVRSGTIGATPKQRTDNWMRIVATNTKFEDINIAGAPEDIVSQNLTLAIPSAKIYVVDNDKLYTS